VDDSLWFTTRSGLFAPGDAAWHEVARYERPLRRLLTRRYGRRLGESQREDVLQDVLLEIKQSLSPRYDRTKGRFRALLQTVVARRVVDELRRARPDALPEELGAPPREAVDAMDLEAALIAAVEACRDHFSGGPGKDLGVLHALTDRLVHGRSVTEIARQEGVSRDVIGRRLGKARAVVFSELVAGELGVDLDDARLPGCVDAFRRGLRQPTGFAGFLEEASEGLREDLEVLWGRFRAALPRFDGDETAAGRELAAGVRMILAPD
jgi:DNA-directed RNA polymerase specialized sigma24 family protein